MVRFRPALLVTALMAIGAGNAVAQQEIYKWRDKSGAVHYSSTPPKSGKFERRTVSHTAPATSAPGSTATASAAPSANAAERPACATARNNLKALNDRSRQVMMDSNGDGKPEAALNEAQRAQEINKTQDFMKQNNCAAG